MASTGGIIFPDKSASQSSERSDPGAPAPSSLVNIRSRQTLRGDIRDGAGHGFRWLSPNAFVENKGDDWV
jgi:hypothetical protein